MSAGAIQLDLFPHVTDAFLAAPEGQSLTTREIYDQVAQSAGLDEAVTGRRVPVGESGQQHNLYQRDVRWKIQTLKHMGLVERDPAQRGAWRVAVRTKTGLHEAIDTTRLVAFSTHLGVAIWGKCEHVLAGLGQQITAVITSPPYPLRKSRAYGGPSDEATYIDFICRAMEPLIKHLAPGGSLAINLGNDVFEQGLPSRSLYAERLLLMLCDRFGLHRMDTLIWSNPSKPPGPVRWASMARVQLNVGYEPIYWLTNDPTKVKSDNRRVLEAHTQQHQQLMGQGGERRYQSYSDGAYRIHPGRFGQRTAGRIPTNVLVRGHTCADSNQYRADARALGLPVHGAGQPLAIPEFLTRFLSDVGDLIVDPFGGTATTGMAAERNGRRWLVVEAMLDYLRAGAERFRPFPGFHLGISDLPRRAA
ncbi:site-specific DNA-methyltransferase [Denitratimonas sp. CY0512]|uniref:site-specific DNA-methyltransferase n=1 Tax=Denitratimonas sp. CY0512 TaxID=3131940 RepID=UPI0030979D47